MIGICERRASLPAVRDSLGYALQHCMIFFSTISHATCCQREGMTNACMSLASDAWPYHFPKSSTFSLIENLGEKKQSTHRTAARRMARRRAERDYLVNIYLNGARGCHVCV